MADEQSTEAKQQRLATVGAIADYWEARQPPLLIAVPWIDSCECCWRCGDKGSLQRCHIIPDSRGGSGKPENLLLLCARCHREAPNVADSRFMLAWLEVTADPDYWHEQAVALFKRIHNREPFSRLRGDPSPDRQRSAMKQAASLSSTHYSDGWWNPATVCAMFELAEELMLADTV